MRPIKFRFWDKMYKTMCCNSEFDYSCVGCEEFDIMQFTGFKDMRGNDIYEGDIIEWRWVDYKNNKNSALATVMWCMDVGQWCVGQDNTTEDSLVNVLQEEDHEVVGNIYENKELYGG